MNTGWSETKTERILMPAMKSGQKLPKDIWILANAHEDRLEETVVELAGEGLKLANRLKEELCAVALEGDPSHLCQLLSEVGVDKIYHTQGRPGTEAYAEIISSLIDMCIPRLVLLDGSPLGYEIASAVAAKNHIGIVTDCHIIHLNDQGRIEATKMMYGEKVNATFEASASRPLIVTAKKGSFDLPETFPKGRAELIVVEPPAVVAPIRKWYYEFMKGDPDKMDLAEAEIIVAVGRGVGGTEGLKIVSQMAKTLGASLGGTRVAIDQGWLPFEKQIGQTGKTVSPNLFIACGISGAFEFTAGMKDSKNIIAINQDPEAPIFKISELSLVGDLRQVIPAVVEQLERLSGKEKN